MARFPAARWSASTAAAEDEGRHSFARIIFHGNVDHMEVAHMMADLGTGDGEL